MNFSQMMRAWVSGDCAKFIAGSPEVQEFQKWWEHILRGVQGTSTARGLDEQEAADGAVDFLIHLRSEGNVSIESLAGFKTGLFRYLRRNKPDAKRELWTITNEALKSLEQKGTIQLVSRFDKRSNRAHNEDEWSLVPHNNEKPYCAFGPDDDSVLADLWSNSVAEPRKKATREAPRYRGSTGAQGVSEKTSRLVSPAEAQTFFCAVLKRYGRVMTMEQLHTALIKTNLVFSMESVSDSALDDAEESGGDPVSNAPAEKLSENTLEFIFQESEHRGNALGAQLCAEDLCTHFTGYYIPKELRSNDVILEGFAGESVQRNSETVRKIPPLIRRQLPFIERPDDFVPDEIAHSDTFVTKDEFAERMATVRIEVFTRSIEVAEKYCKQKCQKIFSGKTR